MIIESHRMHRYNVLFHQPVFRNSISRFEIANFVGKIDLHNRCINSSPRRINFVSNRFDFQFRRIESCSISVTNELKLKKFLFSCRHRDERVVLFDSKMSHRRWPSSFIFRNSEKLSAFLLSPYSLIFNFYPRSIQSTFSS